MTIVTVEPLQLVGIGICIFTSVYMLYEYIKERFNKIELRLAKLQEQMK